MRKGFYALLVMLVAASTAVLFGGAATSFAASGTSPVRTGLNPGFEFRETPDADQEISGAHKANHVPANGIPRVQSSPVDGGFGLGVNIDGLNFADQRTADGRNQFSLEPPDQALCVGNDYVLEAVNDVFRIYTTSGAPVSGVQALNPFFTQDHAIIRSNPRVYGTFLSDPKCLYDPDNGGHFFFTILGIDVDPATGDFLGNSHVFIAVSRTNVPTTNRDGWWFYDLNTTNADPDASVFGGGPNQVQNPGCPCFGDQPLIGADQYGFYVSTNEYPIFVAGFNGAELYALSKHAMETGTLKGQAFLNNSLPLQEGTSYSLQPATSPTSADWETAAGGTEYFLSALEFGAPDNRIAEWAVTNTSSLDTATPAVHFVGPAIVASETYAFPPDAEQKAGPTPLADAAPSLLGKPGNGPKEHENLIASNDDRMQQVVFADHLLYSGLNTAAKTENGETNTAGAYFIVQPAINGSPTAATLTGSMHAQGYIAVNRNNVLFPAAGVGPDGRGAYTFTVTGIDYYPSAAYIRVTPNGITGPIGLAGVGQAPADGFTGYRIFGGDGTERWGDYFAGQWYNGSIWLASEYIPGTFGYPPFLANWGTRVFSVTP